MRGFRIRVRVLLGMTAAAGLLLVPADHSDAQTKWGVRLEYGRIFMDESGSYCTAATTAFIQEYGKSGVQQFRTQIYFINKYWASSPASYWFGEAWRSRSATTLPFPNDQHSYWWRSSWRAWDTWVRNREQVVRLKIVGVRPSFWQPDLVQWREVGVCSFVAPAIETGRQGY